MEKRFSFGKNWQDYLSVIDDARIEEARKNLQSFLGVQSLADKNFLDIGSGSGIHSLAARLMGGRVFSFDYDKDAVLSTQELKQRFLPNDPLWRIEQGSVLDRTYLQSLGFFDVCYAWGVLHHTGALWQALYNAQVVLRPGGLLFIGIYNDEGIKSSVWKIIKRLYNSSALGRIILTPIFYSLFFLTGLLIDIAKLKNPILRYREHKKYRGMSLLHDWKDWLGGYPYQPAEPQQIIGFFENLGFELVHFEPTRHGFGNNQFLFSKRVEA